MLSVIKKAIQTAAFVAALVVGMSTNSHATSLAANTDYSLTGKFTFVAIGQNGAPSYVFSGSYQPGASLSIGNLNGNVFDTVSSTGAFNFTISNYNATTGVTGSQVGTATGSLNSQWSNVKVDIAHDVAAGLQGQVSGGALLFNVNGTINGNAFGLTSGLDQKFATVGLGQLGGVYDNVVTYLGPTWSVVLGDIGVGTNDVFKSWFMGNSVIFGKNYVISGDVHTNLSAVPEPTTVGLLSMGLLGGALRRRRKA